MKPRSDVRPAIRAGHRDGLGTIYSESGGLIEQSAETILKAASGWDVDIISPWRRVLPRTVFSGLDGETPSTLYVTSARIILVREIDIWREVKGDLTPLGLPTAAAKEMELRKLKSAGIRRYCEMLPEHLQVVKSKVKRQPRSWLSMRLLGTEGRRYSVTMWSWRGPDNETLSLVESRFRLRRADRAV